MRLLKILFWIPLIGELIFLSLSHKDFVRDELSFEYMRRLGIFHGTCFAILIIILAYYV